MHPWSVVYSNKMSAVLDTSHSANPDIKFEKVKFSEMIKKTGGTLWTTWKVGTGMFH